MLQRLMIGHFQKRDCFCFAHRRVEREIKRAGMDKKRVHLLKDPPPVAVLMLLHADH